MSDGPNPLGWLTTYGDLVTNLMLFFIVLYAMSNVEVDKLLMLSDSLKKALHKTAVDSTQTGAALLSDPRRSTKTTAVSEAIQEAVKALGIEKGISISEDERGTVITLVDSYFFSPGSIMVQSEVKPILSEVAKFVKETNATAYVEGHTDDTRMNKPPIISNWELSSLRATEVVRYFISQGVTPKNLVALGYADTKPLVPNISNENRARNRRIDIVLVNAILVLKKPKIQEPTTLDIIGDDKDIKERVKLFEAERELGFNKENAEKKPEDATPAGNE